MNEEYSFNPFSYSVRKLNAIVFLHRSTVWSLLPTLHIVQHLMVLYLVLYIFYVWFLRSLTSDLCVLLYILWTVHHGTHTCARPTGYTLFLNNLFQLHYRHVLNKCSSSGGLHRQLTVFYRASFEESSHWLSCQQLDSS